MVVLLKPSFCAQLANVYYRLLVQVFRRGFAKIFIEVAYERFAGRTKCKEEFIKVNKLVSVLSLVMSNKFKGCKRVVDV